MPAALLDDAHDLGNGLCNLGKLATVGLGGMDQPVLDRPGNLTALCPTLNYHPESITF
ncbi:Hypothetical protein NGAL_HAMBI490_54780 [Neorhizobium galegae bv. officinalis]|nr:Hypothetical protein NGAL_HAMBI490_54780 [Neorhizobium galegae bv. officinalis]